MIKEYNEWYWKLYRWFKWDAMYLPHSIIKGVKNLWKWLPIVWKDRDWDDYYIFAVLKFKIKNTADYIESNKTYVGWENDVRYMRICEKLIDRITDDYYQMEYFDYLEQKMYVEDGKLEFETIKDNTFNYIKQYPAAYKKVVFDPKYESYKVTNSGICIAMGMVRHAKARRLLFLILERKIEGWWD